MLESFKYGLSVTWRKSLLIIILFLSNVLGLLALPLCKVRSCSHFVWDIRGEECRAWSSLLDRRGVSSGQDRYGFHIYMDAGLLAARSLAADAAH